MAQHYLLNGLAGWRAASLSNAMLADGGSVLILQQLPGSERPLADAAGSLGGLQAAIGVAVDSQDRVYILDGVTCTVKRFDRCLKQFATLPCVGGIGAAPRQFSSPNGMAISCRNDLHITDTGNRRVQVFSLKGFALRAIWGPFTVQQTATTISVEAAVPKLVWPATGTDCGPEIIYPPQTWQPWDIAITRTNWNYVSDYANGLIHVFDPAGCWRRAFTGSGPSEPQLVKPTRLAIDREGRIYVLQEGKSYVVVLDADGKYLGQVTEPDQIEGRFCPVAVAVDINGNLCLSDCMTRQVYFYQPNGDGGWCGFHCCGAMNSFASSLAFDLSGNPLTANGGNSVCQLEPQAAYPLQGRYYSEPLDSKTYQCVWHRVVLRARVPSGCTIRVDTFTSESAKTIEEVLTLPESRWSTGQSDVNPDSCDWDCLILSPPGRYLWLRISLSGEGVSTPCIERVKVYYPRSSSLQYLPSVYREDPVSADFLARFLSIFDTMRGQTSALLAGIARYFDPTATPANRRNQGGPDFLSWLASWLGLSLESNWPIEKRRKLVQQAHRLFALRGTVEGLKLQVELYAGVRPQVLELFRLRRWMMLISSTLGDCSTLFGTGVLKRLEVGVNSTIGQFQLIDYGNPSLDLFNQYAYQFVVVVPRWPGATASDELTLQQIIALAQPAHTVGTLQWAEPRMRIGLQAFIGVDSVIGKYPVGVIEGQGQLGYDTVLGSPSEEAMRPQVRVGQTSRLGCGTRLN
ncbi:MAG TPA: phage tail protein [Candidatus Angelobacter sp.]